MIDFGVSREEFFSNYFERQPLLRRQGIGSRAIAWRDIDQALFAWDPRDGLIRLYRNGLVPQSDYIETFQELGMPRCRIVKESLYQSMREGATLVMNRIDTKSEPINELTLSVSQFFQERSLANAYAAFGGRGTFSTHWDTHDVVAAQLIGKKHWRVYRPTLSLPLPHQTSRDHKKDCPPEPVLDVVLDPGDVLYIPRGWWHCADPIDAQETLHVAVGIHPALLLGYLTWLIGEVFPQHIALRGCLRSNGEAREALEAAAATVACLFQDERNVSRFRNDLRRAERVTSSFDLGHFCRGLELPDHSEVRLNSCYGLNIDDQKLAINGNLLNIDEMSQRALVSLLGKGEAEPDEVDESVVSKGDRLRQLKYELARRDVLRFLRRSASD